VNKDIQYTCSNIRKRLRWTLKHAKMRLQPGLDRKRIFVYLWPRERVWWLQMSFSLWEN